MLIVMSNFYFFSPGGKYLIYFDGKASSYFSYNLFSGKTVNISENIPTRLGNENNQEGLGGSFQWPVGIAGWLKDDNALFIYDNYDIWQVDPSATQTFGKYYQWLWTAKSISNCELVNESTIYSSKETLLLTAFNTQNKYNGFYRKYLGKTGDPELVTMVPSYIYATPSSA